MKIQEARRCNCDPPCGLFYLLIDGNWFSTENGDDLILVNENNDVIHELEIMDTKLALEEIFSYNQRFPEFV